MKGTPYIYQGEEIGMTNLPISCIKEVNDIESINMYKERIALGYAKEEIIASINAKGRDNARTPMQWDLSPNAGFTDGNPWLHINPNYKDVNVKSSLSDANSIFYTYQKLISLRKKEPIITYGAYELLTNTEEVVFAYYRKYKSERWLIVTNITEKESMFFMEDIGREIIISNYNRNEISQGKNILRPYEAFVVRC